MKEQIKTTMSNVLGVDIKDIDTHSNRESIPGWDSLKHMNLVIALEGEFNIRFTNTEITNLISYDYIVQLITNKINNA